MKTEAIREALAQYLRCRLAVSAPQRSAQVRAALEELEALEAAQAPSRFANGPALAPDVARRIAEQLGAKYPPACGFRSFVEDAQFRAYPDAKIRTGPMCKATKGTGDLHFICWREDGHREDHDFRPGVVATGAGSSGGLAAMSDWELAQKISDSRYVMEKVAPLAHRCPHENVGCGTTRVCEVCKDAPPRRLVHQCPAPEHAPDCRIGHARAVSCTEANTEAIRAARPSYGEFTTAPAAKGENCR